MKGRGNGGLNNNCGRLLDGAMDPLPERNGGAYDKRNDRVLYGIVYRDIRGSVLAWINADDKRGGSNQ